MASTIFKRKLRRLTKILPTSSKEKELCWLKRAINHIHHKAGTEGAIGDYKGCWKHPTPGPGCEK
eukprot:scaffold65688_cov15-Tisochrysis_lutea.AAC.1